MKKDEVIIKGTKDGILVYLNSSDKFSDLITKLREKFQETDDFLTGSSVTIDLGAQSMSEVQLGELQQLCAEFGLTLKRILGGPVGGSRSVDPAAGGAGRKNAATKTAPVGQNQIRTVARHSANEAVNQSVRQAAASAASPVESHSGYRRDDLKELKENELADENTILIQRTLRSGQSVHYPGNVVILGDVNPGAEVIASGNIVVMGCLRGVAHAGATGSEQAVVTAFRLQPTQLRIANHITRAPDGEYPEPDQPETARIRDGMVVIEKY